LYEGKLLKRAEAPSVHQQIEGKGVAQSESEHQKYSSWSRAENCEKDRYAHIEHSSTV